MFAEQLPAFTISVPTCWNGENESNIFSLLCCVFVCFCSAIFLSEAGREFILNYLNRLFCWFPSAATNRTWQVSVRGNYYHNWSRNSYFLWTTFGSPVCVSQDIIHSRNVSVPWPCGGACEPPGISCCWCCSSRCSASPRRRAARWWSWRRWDPPGSWGSHRWPSAPYTPLARPPPPLQGRNNTGYRLRAGKSTEPVCSIRGTPAPKNTFRL